MSQVAAVIVAGGDGTRTGRARPKQYESLLGRKVLEWSVEAFLQHPNVGHLVVVSGADQESIGPFPGGFMGVRWAFADPVGTQWPRSTRSAAGYTGPDP